MAESQAVFNVA